jgi:competence protein ComEC
VLILLCVAIVGVTHVSYEVWFQTPEKKPGITAHALSVGQGTAVLFETPDESQILVDGGPGPRILPLLSQRLPWYDRTIEFVAATHQDRDHIGGLVDVLERYKLGTVVWNGQHSNQPAAERFVELLQGAKVRKRQVVGAGDVFRVGASTTIRVLAPRYRPQRIGTNRGSLVLHIQFGNTTFLVPGDVPAAIERYLVDAYGDALASDVLVLGHHGSDTSTSEVFLEHVAPEVAIVSAGADNMYGHPAPSVIERVQEHGAAIYYTASGTVQVHSNGSELVTEQK